MSAELSVLLLRKLLAQVGNLSHCRLREDPLFRGVQSLHATLSVVGLASSEVCIRRRRRARNHPVALRGIFSSCNRIVLVFLLDVGRQLSERQFHNAAVELDHDPVRFDAAYRGVFIFFALSRCEVLGECQGRGQRKN